jgi:ribose transport system ATP-binding protein
LFSPATMGVSAHAQPAPVLSLKSVTKRYPGVIALDGVDFELRAGEVHVVLGENGAGKSTLIRAIAGATSVDEGEILLDSAPVQHLSVQKRRDLGIAVIYQELSLVPTMTVMQNLFLGKEFTLGPGLGQQFRFRDRRRMASFSGDLLQRLRIDVDPRDRVGSLPVSQRQLVEIARAVAFNARVIVMDEPTTSLGPDEKARLFAVISDLKAKGIAIIYVSHVLEDCVALGDRITILRDGRYIDTLPRGAAEPADLVPLITGRSFSERYPDIASEGGETILKVSNLSRSKAFKDVSFELRRGEILGFAGLVGAGRTDLVRAIAGLDGVDSGSIEIGGRKMRPGSPRRGLRNGVAILTEDRKAQGILGNLDVQTNLAATAINLPETQVGRRLAAPGGFLRRRAIAAFARERIAAFRIKTPSSRQRIAHLSGGNQQKVLLARAIAADARVLILDEPTKGIDAGAKVEIYGVLATLVANGASIIIVSSETPEVIAVCSRVLVMARGRITAELRKGEATPEAIVAHSTLSPALVAESGATS